MKLSNHLTIRLSGIFILIMLVWSIIYFFFQMTEIYDGIDEGLNNLKQEFIYEANRSPDFVVDMEKHNPLNIIIDKISFEEAKDFKETYTASKVYFITEEEEEEVRMLTTAFFCEQNNQYYKLKIFTSTVESDDLIKSMLYLLIALWVCLALVIILVIKRVIHSSNKPFYQLLHDLKNFKLGDGKMIEFPANNIYEYTELNSSVKDLLEDNINAYNEQKNFIENASHELQTPLSITIGKLELIMNSNKLDQQQLEEMASALNSLNRMKRLNSSLLLLSKIKNKQFSEKEAVEFLRKASFVLCRKALRGKVDHLLGFRSASGDGGHAFDGVRNTDIHFAHADHLVIRSGKREIILATRQRLVELVQGVVSRIGFHRIDSILCACLFFVGFAGQNDLAVVGFQAEIVVIVFAGKNFKFCHNFDFLSL